VLLKYPKGQHDIELPEEPKTPDQPPEPSNPKLVTESNATTEPQSEEPTKKLLVTFLGNTIDALNREFGYLILTTNSSDSSNSHSATPKITLNYLICKTVVISHLQEIPSRISAQLP
jgi:hypothetical protein